MYCARFGRLLRRKFGRQPRMTRIARMNVRSARNSPARATSNRRFRLIAPLPICYFFGREGGDDFFEAWIAAQRIPIGTETNIAVSYTCGDFGESFQLLDGQVALGSPRTDDGIKIKDVRAIQGILRYRRKLECPAAVPQCLFFSPKASIDQTQNAQNRAVIRLRSNRFLLSRTRGGKGGLRREDVSFHSSYQSLQISSAKSHPTYASCIKCILALRAQRRQGAIGGGGVNPLVETERKIRSYNRMRSSGVGSLIQVDTSTSGPVINVLWFDGNEPITNLSFFFIFAQ